MREIDVGDLRHRVIWETPGPPTRDAMNQARPAWTTLGEFWALVEPLTGFELVNAKQLKPELSTKVTMRNVGAIKPTDRLIYTQTMTALNVVFVFRLDRWNRFLTLHCTESPLALAAS